MDFDFSLSIGYYWFIFLWTFSVFLITGFYWLSYSKYNFRAPKIKKKKNKIKKYKCGRFSLFLTILSFIVLLLSWVINPLVFYHLGIPFFIIEGDVITAQILKVLNFFNKYYNEFFKE